jgi:hypothetical protein
MRYRQLACFVVSMIAIVFGGTVHAAIISQYTFTDAVGSPGVLNRAATTVADDVTAGNITNAPGGAVTLVRTTSQGYPAEPVLSAARNVDGPHQVFFTFDVDANAGFHLDLSSLTFDVSRGGGSTPRTYDIRTSADNFMTSLTGVVPILTTRTPPLSVFTPVTVPLSGPQFQNLSSPLTFQFRFFTPGVSQNIDFDNITVNGTVVPEPGILALLAVVAGGWMFRRRRGEV